MSAEEAQSLLRFYALFRFGVSRDRRIMVARVIASLEIKLIWLLQYDEPMRLFNPEVKNNIDYMDTC